jgi:hypothetical protein
MADVYLAEAYSLFEIWIATPTASLRGALATKQSILPTGTAVKWIASLRSQ